MRTKEDARKPLLDLAGFQVFLAGRIWVFANTEGRLYLLFMLTATFISTLLLRLAVATSNQWFGVYCALIAIPTGVVALLGGTYGLSQFLTRRHHPSRQLMLISVACL